MSVAPPETYLADLNPAQREAVLTTEGPLLVIAGAGSGKTRVLTYRVAHLLRAVGAKPPEILAITFTNKAANEMKERLERLIGPPARALWVMTFHAACGRIFRREAERLGYRSNFTIYDSQDQQRLVKACLEELDKDPKRFVPRGIHAQISNLKNQLVLPAEALERVSSFYDQTVAEVYDLYQRRLHASNAVDFDDLLLLTVQVLERFPDAREKWQKAFRYILVDEYQDTNHAQYRLLQILGEQHQNVCAVGDPDQCLVAGTPITMADGSTKPIEDVRVGDEVLSCYGSGRFGPGRVLRTHRSVRTDGVAITTASGRRIVSTPEHTHFAGFVRADDPATRRVIVSLCGEAQAHGPAHTVTVAGRDRADRRVLEAAGLRLASARVGGEEWQLESAYADFARLAEDVMQIQDAVGGDVELTARLAKEGNSLPFMPAASVRPGMVMVGEDGEFDLVTEVERVELTQPVHDLDVERTHNFVAAGLVTHNSIYAFRGADIRNILEFERDFAGTRTIALEQNYRSTNHILRAANGVISHNRERKPKELFSDLGDGDAVRVLEVEDEQSEARFVAAEVAQLIADGWSGREIAVFYRMNAQSRAVEQVLRMNDVAYQVIGGPRFYERAEIKDATAYLQVIDNPADVVSLTRIANRPRRGIGDTTLGRLQAWADLNAATLYEALGNAEAAGITGAALRAVQGFHTLMQSLRSAAQELDVADLLQAVYDRSGMLEALQAERTIEARGRIENLESFVDGARESQAETLSGFLQEISLYSDQDAIAEESGAVTLMTLHNAKGLEFRAVFLVGCEEEIFPSSRAIEEQGVEEERRLFYVGMTRAKERLTLTHASSRLLWGRTTHNLPSRFLDELPEREIERHTLRPASWAAYGRPAASIAPRQDAPSLATGDSVRHGTLGEGVVTRIEPGGVVTVRFAADGSERRLMLDYAPLEKIA